MRTAPSTATSRTTNGTTNGTTSSSQPVHVVVDAVIDAAPATVFAMITDITRMGDWSPETVSAAWLDGATKAAEGARFKGNNRFGRLQWSTKPTITRVEQDRVFEFAVPGKSGAIWRYDLRSTEAGATAITESVHQQRPLPAPIRFLQRRAGVTDRAANLREGMTITLQRLSAAATSTTPNSQTTEILA